MCCEGSFVSVACSDEDTLSSDGSRFRITYKDPVSGFDRSRVKGIVGRLVRVKDMATATALEVAAGGRVSY